MRHLRKYANYAFAFRDAERVAECLERVVARAATLPTGCMVLPAHKDGYARLTFAGLSWQAHRLLWMLERGDIGSLVLDHKCRNKACVNLDHLEPVTNQENVRRGKVFAHGGKCAKGHDLRLGQRGWLRCPTCKNDNFKARYYADAAFRAEHQERRRASDKRRRSAER